MGRRLPFCLDVTSATFEKLDSLLRSVCDGLGSAVQGVYPPPHQEQEYIAIATLNLLKLQVRHYVCISSVGGRGGWSGAVRLLCFGGRGIRSCLASMFGGGDACVILKMSSYWNSAEISIFKNG